mgnify:CR=1 FL=1
MYKNAKYAKDASGENTSILVEINGLKSVVPIDANNTDYANIMQLVAEGKLTIAPAE